MEDNYFIISDIIGEIISINSKIELSLSISLASKYLADYIYNISDIKLNYADKFNSIFHKLKTLKLFRHSHTGFYCKYFTKLSTIHTLHIVNHIDFKNICLTHFTNLTELNFAVSNCEQINYNYSSLKKITGSHTNDNSVFHKCYNVENLTIHSLCGDQTCFNKFVHSKLTCLTVYSTAVYIHRFNENYFVNIVTLSLDHVTIDFSRYSFPMLTSLKLFHIIHYQILCNMFRLKSLLLHKYSGNKNIYVKNISTLKYLTIENFDKLEISNIFDVNDSNKIVLHDEIENLKGIEINNDKSFEIEYSNNVVDSLRKLKYIEYCLTNGCQKEKHIFHTKHEIEGIFSGEETTNVVIIK